MVWATPNEVGGTVLIVGNSGYYHHPLLGSLHSIQNRTLPLEWEVCFVDVIQHERDFYEGLLSCGNVTR